jgi:hypothetical protein
MVEIITVYLESELARRIQEMAVQLRQSRNKTIKQILELALAMGCTVEDGVLKIKVQPIREGIVPEKEIRKAVPPPPEVQIEELKKEMEERINRLERQIQELIRLKYGNVIVVEGEKGGEKKNDKQR